jgi:hypothetical protein
MVDDEPRVGVAVDQGGARDVDREIVVDGRAHDAVEPRIELHHIGVSPNQIARYANATGELRADLDAADAEVMRAITRILDQVRVERGAAPTASAADLFFAECELAHTAATDGASIAGSWRFPQHHDMVEALASDRADQPFNMTVLPR